MFTRICSSALLGVDAYKVFVEVDCARGLPGFMMVGLPDQSVKESRDRVRSALRNNGYHFPQKYITVNLAPANIAKEGSAFDLPLALGLLASSDQLSQSAVGKFLIAAELALDGHLRPIRGALSMAASVRNDSNLEGIIVPSDNAGEAAVVSGLPVYPAKHLSEVVAFLNGQPIIEPYQINVAEVFSHRVKYEADFFDVKGQEHVKRALEVAAAGGHNIIMVGPPGSGKTMLAKRLPTILPDLSLEESLETTKVHSISGQLDDGQSLVRRRPFRAPHHTISNAGLIGGGRIPHPGEVSMAHNGVLFLDEVPEFNRDVLEVLREPMESGSVTISRVQASLVFPARFMLAAACNPCPCGHFGNPRKECVCTPEKIHRYISKLSGPLLDRIDIHVEVPALPYEELMAQRSGETSDQIRERVTSCREVQAERYRDRHYFCNAHLHAGDMDDFIGMEKTAQKLLQKAIECLGLSARAYDRILKVSRTIADLDRAETITETHVSEAIQYRALDRKFWASGQQAA